MFKTTLAAFKGGPLDNTFREIVGEPRIHQVQILPNLSGEQMVRYLRGRPIEGAPEPKAVEYERTDKTIGGAVVYKLKENN